MSEFSLDIHSQIHTHRRGGGGGGPTTTTSRRRNVTTGDETDDVEGGGGGEGGGEGGESPHADSTMLSPTRSFACNDHHTDKQHLTDIADISELDDFDHVLSGVNDAAADTDTPSAAPPRVPVYPHNFKTPVWSLSAMQHRHVIKDGGEKAEKLMNELLRRSQRAVMDAERRAFDATV